MGQLFFGDRDQSDCGSGPVFFALAPGSGLVDNGFALSGLRAGHRSACYFADGLQRLNLLEYSQPTLWPQLHHPRSDLIGYARYANNVGFVFPAHRSGVGAWDIGWSVHRNGDAIHSRHPQWDFSATNTRDTRSDPSQPAPAKKLSSLFDALYLV